MIRIPQWPYGLAVDPQGLARVGQCSGMIAPLIASAVLDQFDDEKFPDSVPHSDDTL